MNLKPILLVVFPTFLGINSKHLGEIQDSLRKEYPEYWVLAMIAEEAEEVFMELSNWKEMSYFNYASLLQIIDPNQYEKLERYRQYTIFGEWETDLSEYDEEDEE